MDATSSPSLVGAQISAMKKATDTQEDVIMKVLESAQVPQQAPLQSSSAITGLGQQLDIKV